MHKRLLKIYSICFFTAPIFSNEISLNAQKKDQIPSYYALCSSLLKNYYDNIQLNIEQTDPEKQHLLMQHFLPGNYSNKSFNLGKRQREENDLGNREHHIVIDVIYKEPWQQNNICYCPGHNTALMLSEARYYIQVRGGSKVNIIITSKVTHLRIDAIGADVTLKDVKPECQQSIQLLQVCADASKVGVCIPVQFLSTIGKNNSTITANKVNHAFLIGKSGSIQNVTFHNLIGTTIMAAFCDIEDTSSAVINGAAPVNVLSMRRNSKNIAQSINNYTDGSLYVNKKSTQNLTSIFPFLINCLEIRPTTAQVHPVNITHETNTLLFEKVNEASTGNCIITPCYERIIEYFTKNRANGFSSTILIGSICAGTRENPLQLFNFSSIHFVPIKKNNTPIAYNYPYYLEINNDTDIKNNFPLSSGKVYYKYPLTGSSYICCLSQNSQYK